MRHINELREGENVREIYLCKQTQSLQTKTGKTYYSLLLQDKTGTLDGKVWDITSAIEHHEAGEYIMVDGRIVMFQDKPQLNISRIRRAREGEYDPAEYMPSSDRNIDEMYSELMALGAQIKTPYLQKLFRSFFVDDAEFIKAFKYHSAAKAVHHGFIGGLLEHTLSVTNLCDGFAKQYELRVTVVGEDVFAAKILSQDLPEDKGKIDWRQGYDHGLSFSACILPDNISNKCIMLVHALGLNFGCIDLIVKPNGEYVFLECNPNGQWLWLELATGMKISYSIANFLSNQ